MLFSFSIVFCLMTCRVCFLQHISLLFLVFQIRFLKETRANKTSQSVNRVVDVTFCGGDGAEQVELKEVPG